MANGILFDLEPLFERDISDEANSLSILFSWAVASLFLDFPFLGSIASYFEICPVKHKALDNIGVDTRYVYFTTELLQGKSKKYIKGLYLHQVIHLIRFHSERENCRGKDITIWKMACEIETYNLLDEFYDKHSITFNTTYSWFEYDKPDLPEKFQNCSSHAIYDELLVLASKIETPIRSSRQFVNLFSEETYSYLFREIGLEVCHHFKFMKHHYLNLDEDVISIEWDRILGIIRSSIQKIWDKNNYPKMIMDDLIKKTEPSTPWHISIEEAMQRVMVSDWHWLPPNRKFVGKYIYFPTITKQSCDLVLAIDSLSVKSIHINKILDQVVAIINGYNSVNLTLIFYSGKIDQIFRIESGSLQDVHYDPTQVTFSKVYIRLQSLPDWLNENDIDPDLLVWVIGSLYFSPSMSPPHYPVLWLSTTENQRVPFGEVYLFDSDENKNS